MLDLAEQRFGRLQAMWPAGYSSGGGVVWACQCDCGAVLPVRSQGLTSGKSKSCGCYRVELTRKRFYRHGHCSGGIKQSPEHKAYSDAKQRCTNPNDPRYQCYGLIGIKFLFNSFAEFLAEVGPRPTGKTWAGRSEYSLDRINPYGHYEPGNVRWADTFQQARNHRRSPTLCQSNL